MNKKNIDDLINNFIPYEFDLEESNQPFTYEKNQLYNILEGLYFNAKEYDNKNILIIEGLNLLYEIILDFTPEELDEFEQTAKYLLMVNRNNNNQLTQQSKLIH